MGLCFCVSGYYQCLFSGCLGCSLPWLGTPVVVCSSCILFLLCFSQYVHHRLPCWPTLAPAHPPLWEFLGGDQGPLGEFWRRVEGFRHLPSFFKEVSHYPCTGAFCRNYSADAKAQRAPEAPGYHDLEIQKTFYGGVG